MALNKYMHPRNKYKSRKPDFKVLSSKYEYFKEKVTVSESGKVILDFKDPAALRVLTQALLEDDFGLTVTIPLDRLIPTVPQRLNYILWLEDMIGQNTPAKGIDIGTGACCVYPLLGCRQNKWKFLASDIDDQNIFFANRNIVNNKMENDIKVKKVTEDTILIGLIEDDESYDFCMCNPPFYSDHLEAQGITTSRSDARSDSSSMSTASEAESIAWGGEVRFVTQMIEESVRLKHKVRLFTSLLGKKTSLSLLKDVLSRNKIDKYSTTEFCQGRTMRWGIAWTFDENIKFPKSYFREKRNEKPPLTMTLSRESSLVVGDYTVQAYTWFIWKLLEELKIYFHINHSGKFYSCFSMKCMENTWSHQRRKKRQQKREHCTTKSGETTEQNPDNVVDTSIDLKNESTDSVDSKNVDTAYDATEQNPDNVVEASVDSKNESTDIAGEVDTKNIDTVNDTTCSKVNDGSEIGEKMETGKVESRKRPVEDEKSECVTKKSKIENNESTVGDCSSELKDSKDDNEVNKDKSVNGCSVESSDLESENKVNKEPENKDKSNTLNRKEIVEQFWKELEDNSGKSGPGKKKMESSFYECIEPFKEDEECLLMCKVVLRKEEGVITLTLTHLAGNKEALHQIMQFFKNKFTVQKK